MASGASGLPVRIELSKASLLFPLATAITRKPVKMFTVKHEKHDSNRLHASSKLDSIIDSILQVIQSKCISYIQFLKVLQENVVRLKQM